MSNDVFATAMAAEVFAAAATATTGKEFAVVAARGGFIVVEPVRSFEVNPATAKFENKSTGLVVIGGKVITPAKEIA